MFVARTLVSAASRLVSMPGLGLEVNPQTSVEISLDAADTSVRATSSSQRTDSHLVWLFLMSGCDTMRCQTMA